MSPIGPNHQALVGGEGWKTDRGTEEERVEETVAAAHSASASRRCPGPGARKEKLSL